MHQIGARNRLPGLELRSDIANHINFSLTADFHLICDMPVTLSYDYEAAPARAAFRVPAVVQSAWHYNRRDLE